MIISKSILSRARCTLFQNICPAFIFIQCFYSNWKFPSLWGASYIYNISHAPWPLRILQQNAAVNIHVCRLRLDSISGTVAKNQSELSFSQSNVFIKKHQITQRYFKYISIRAVTHAELTLKQWLDAHSRTCKHTGVFPPPFCSRYGK